MNDNMFLVLNKGEWLTMKIFTEEEIDAADKRGFIATKNGVDCYVSCFIPTTLTNNNDN